MNIPRLAVIGVFVALIFLGICETAAHAGVNARTPAAQAPPERPCTFQNRLDIEILNGVWFECSCEALIIGTVCDWYEITSAAQEPAASRKVNRAKPKHRRIAIHVAHPAVVA